MKTTKIIGVHSGHDASACLLVGNTVVSSISKERLTRIKHDKGDPTICVDYLLKNYGLEPSDIDLVIRSNWFDAEGLDNDYYTKFPKVEVTYKHHLLHAYASSVVSTADEAIVIVNDGRGCRAQDNGEYELPSNFFEVESIYRLYRGRLYELEKHYRPYYSNKYHWGSHIDSLGYAYAAISKIIFGSAFGAGKVMALAALAKKDINIPNPFIDNNEYPFSINSEWIDYLLSCPKDLKWQSPLAAELCANIQLGIENYYLYRSKFLVDKYQIEDILLGGGVALNCKNNGVLANSPWIKSINIFPATGDDGLSVGAAVWKLREQFKNYNPISYDISQGYNYDTTIDIQTDIIDEICSLLENGATLGFFQKGSEFGPRALCNRSIITSADSLDYKIKLNGSIKLREEFRPFGGIVLDRNLDKVTSDTLASPYMLSAVRAYPWFVNQYPAIIHKDNTTRLQVIKPNDGLIAKILKNYERRTGKIALLNTSFNSKDEPIVETLSEARACSKKIGLDYLYFNGKIEKVND